MEIVNLKKRKEKKTTVVNIKFTYEHKPQILVSIEFTIFCNTNMYTALYINPHRYREM